MESSAETTLALKSIRSKSAILRQELRRTVTNDSHAMTWYTANEMLSLDTPSPSCRVLVEALFSDIDALYSSQLHTREERRRTVLTNEVLVDAFVFLERAVLDAVDLTSRQFKAIVDKHLSKDCLRKFRVEIMNVVHAEDALPVGVLLPKSGSDPSVFRLEVTSETEGVANNKTFLYESSKLEDLLAKLSEKMPSYAFVRRLNFSGIMSMIPTLLEQCDVFARMNVGELDITCGDEQKRAMPSREIITTVNAFASVNELSLYIFELTEVGDDFLKACRERGILMLGLYAADAPAVSTNGLIDFCFGPTREAREHADRSVYDLSYFDEALFHRVLEGCSRAGRESDSAVKTVEKLRHKVTLSMMVDHGDPQETIDRYGQLLLQHYKLTEQEEEEDDDDDEEDSYVAIVEKRATVWWRLKASEDGKVVVSCEVEPF